MVIFNKKSLKDNDEFVSLGNIRIETVESYSYLGLTLHMNGSMKSAVNNLCCKVLRALYSLKKQVRREDLSVKALSNLFNFLIKPILAYGSSIWAPHESIIKDISNYHDILTSNGPLAQLRCKNTSITASQNE